MSEDENVEVIKSIYTAFARGDVNYILSRIAPDVTRFCHFDPIIPWSGTFTGIGNVPSFFKAISESVVIESFIPCEYIASGDTVVSTGEFGCRVKSTGKSAVSRWVFIWKLRSNRVYSFEQFHGPELADAFR